MKKIRLAKNIKYKEEFFKPIVEKSLSIANICRELDIRPVGGNYKTIHYYINLYNIDVTHFTGQGWNIGDNYRPIKESLKLNDILIENSTYLNSTALKKRLIKENILEYKCADCGIDNWNNKQLSLHLDHINGNNRDNRIENLRLLCPNCHSQTSTYCNRNNVNNIQEYKQELYDEYKKITEIDKTNINRCIDCGAEISLKSKRCVKCHLIYVNVATNYCECGKEIKKDSTYCAECIKIKKRKIIRPSYPQLLNEINETNKNQVAKKYNITRNTLLKWLIFYEKQL